MSFGSVVKDVFGGIAKVFAHDVEPVVVKVLGQDAASKLAVAVESVIGTNIGSIVRDVVAEVRSLKVTDENGKIRFVSGPEAREAALKQLGSDARIVASGITTSLLNLLVELAVSTVEKELLPVAIPLEVGAALAGVKKPEHY